jgi:hypothetical protein
MQKGSIMEVAAIAACLSVVLSAITLWKSAKDKKIDKLDWRFDKIDEKFDKFERKMNEGFTRIDLRFDHIENQLIDIRKDMSDIKGRVTFIEGSVFGRSIIVDVNPRSEAAKEMWKRRRAKKLENRA